MRPKKKKKTCGASSPTRDLTTTGPPSVEKAEDEVSVAGETPSVAPGTPPEAPIAGAEGAGAEPAAPPPPRTPWPVGPIVEEVPAGGTPTAEEAPVSQAEATETLLEKAPRTGVEGAHTSPPRSVVIAASPRSPGGDPERGTDPSSSRGPARDPSEPNCESWALVARRPTGGIPSYVVAIQAVQRCLD
jgi:hypothetical protein